MRWILTWTMTRWRRMVARHRGRRGWGRWHRAATARGGSWLTSRTIRHVIAAWLWPIRTGRRRGRRRRHRCFVVRPPQFLTAVTAFMLFEMHPLWKALIADTTPERFLTWVDPLVDSQVSLLRKRLVAGVTWVELLACVDAVVVVEVASLWKWFVASETGVRSLT